MISLTLCVLLRSGGEKKDFSTAILVHKKNKHRLVATEVSSGEPGMGGCAAC